MRSVLCVFLAALAACGGGRQTDGAGTGNHPVQFPVTVDVVGTGAIRGAGKNCIDHCVWQVPAGALHLEAVAAASWQFQAWSAACASASCDLIVGAPLSLTATFTQSRQTPPAPPPPPQTPPPMQRLTVTIVGAGHVVSTPAGIDCTATCAGDFPRGTQVALAATPAPGMLFAGFDGVCSSIDGCAPVMSQDVSVTVTFAPVPPPAPSGTCDGLMPAAVPSPISIPPFDGLLVGGTSDATGTDFLFSTARDFTGLRDYHFVRVENGSASESGSLEIRDAFAQSQPRVLRFLPIVARGRPLRRPRVRRHPAQDRIACHSVAGR